MRTFNLPDLGEGLVEAEIVSWHVGPGDNVVTDQPLVSVETDKAVVEVPAPFSGRVAELFGAAGAAIKVGEPLVGFEDDGAEEDADKGTVAGRLPDQETTVDEAAVEKRGGRARFRATPAVRALARRLKIDLSNVSPSGKGGAITADDVKRVAAVLSEAEPAEPLKGVRRAMAHRMAQSHAEVAPATVHEEADVEDWFAAAGGTPSGGTDVTVRLIEAIAAGCRAAPALNAWYESANESRRIMKAIHLGLAVDTPDGLFVPVMRDVGARDAADLRRGLDAIKAAISARDIPPDEMRGATISLSNFGVLGAGRFAALVVVPPQVAIIGVGRISPTLVMSEAGPVARRMLPLSLTFDHRVVNGGEASRFLAAMMADLARTD